MESRPLDTIFSMMEEFGLSPIETGQTIRSMMPEDPDMGTLVLLEAVLYSQRKEKEKNEPKPEEPGKTT